MTKALIATVLFKCVGNLYPAEWKKKGRKKSKLNEKENELGGKNNTTTQTQLIQLTEIRCGKLKGGRRLPSTPASCGEKMRASPQGDVLM